MKKKILIFTAFLLFLAGGFSACKEEIREEPKDTLSLVNTKWKLIGIVDVQADSLRNLEPKECTQCYTLAFDTDSTFSGQSFMNRTLFPFCCRYNIDYTTGSLRFTDICGTEVGVQGESDEELYWQTLRKIQSFIINNIHTRELYLYYDDGKKYLKCNEIGD